MSTSISFQLPDLLALTRKFDLRTNRRCRGVLDASQEWLSGLNEVLSEEEIRRIPGQKMGLLASLCFPTCDTPQLRLVTDFLGLLVIANERVKRGGGSGSEWQDVDVEKTGFVELLNSHALFKHLEPRISRLKQSTSERWHKQFTSSILAFRSAQLKAIELRYQNTLAFEDYIELCCTLSGIGIIFDFLESAEGLNINLVDKDAEKMNLLRRHAAEFISLSFDIFSYNNDQAANCQLNIISVLDSQQNLALQGAVSSTGELVKAKLDAFNAAEASFWARHEAPNPAPPSSIFSYIASFFYTPPPSTVVDDLAPEIRNDVALFVRGLKDCMNGALNWAYESEMFFGEKGGAIRSFGWVFLKPTRSDS